MDQPSIPLLDGGDVPSADRKADVVVGATLPDLAASSGQAGSGEAQSAFDFHTRDGMPVDKSGGGAIPSLLVEHTGDGEQWTSRDFLRSID